MDSSAFGFIENTQIFSLVSDENNTPAFTVALSLNLQLWVSK